MPRIAAPTVAEHHARRRRALLDAARSLLAETGQAPWMSAVGKRAGLARSSVYHYFDSPDALLEAVVGDVFPDWAGQVQGRVDRARSPAERVWAYVEANVALFAGSERAVAQALARVVDPGVLRAPMQEFHRQLQVPLRTALEALGEPEAPAVAELIDALVLHACRELDPDDAAHHEATLSRLRRLLSGYLGLPSHREPL